MNVPLVRSQEKAGARGLNEGSKVFVFLTASNPGRQVGVKPTSPSSERTRGKIDHLISIEEIPRYTRLSFSILTK